MTVIGLLILPLLVSCTFSPPDPSPPIVELSGDTCNIKYGENSYKATVTHMLQGVTSITFAEPDTINGIVYTFSGNGCSIIFGDLTFSTDRSFMGDTALPQIICDVMSSMQGENALTYVQKEEPQSSTLTTAIFTGKTQKYNYKVTTDFNSGYIKEIEVGDCDLLLTFSNK